MKKFLVILMVVAMSSFLFVGCLPGTTTPVVPVEPVEPVEPVVPVVPATNTPIISAISDGVSLTATTTQYVNKTEAADGVTVSGSAATLAEVAVYINDVAIAATANVTATGTWALIITKAELGIDGVKTVKAVASEAGLADATSTSYDFTLDTVAPGIKEVKATAEKAKVPGTATETTGGTALTSVTAGATTKDIVSYF